MNSSPPDTEAANSLLQEAMRCHQEGDLYEADLLYAQTLMLLPENPQALRLRGILARERGEIERSLELLQRAAQTAPDTTAALGEIALTQMAAGELAAAEQTLRDALLIDAESAPIHSNLGALLQHRGHVNAAIDSYKRALELQHDDVEVRCNLAKALADAGQTDTALNECAIAAEHSDNHPYVLATRGAVLTDSERYADAQLVLKESIQLDPHNDMALVNLALCSYELGDIETACQLLQQAVSNNPWNARAVADLANCFCALGQTADALELCTGFLRENPGERLVIAAYALALHNAGQVDQARALTDCDTLVRVYDLPCPTSFPDIETFNAALTKRICSDLSRLTDPISKSTSGGSQTGELDLHTNDVLTCFTNELRPLIHQASDSYVAAGLSQHPLMAAASADWSLRAWGTILPGGGRQTSHMHPLGWVSGVYYTCLPDDMSAADAEAGWLEIGRPATRFFRNVEPESKRYEPRPGRLLLFPSWFWHQTVPFKSAGERISIAFDVMPKSMLRML
jgi:uncharacterized protein (TIGR02466 family)